MEVDIKKEVIDEEDTSCMEWQQFEQVDIKTEVCEDEDEEKQVHDNSEYQQIGEAPQFVLVELANAEGKKSPHQSHAVSGQCPELETPGSSNNTQHKKKKIKPLKYLCVFCSLSFSSKHGKNTHIGLVHRENTKHSSKYSHIELSNQPLNCDDLFCAMCNYKTIQRRHLITHMENKHFYELKIPYICRLCNKQLSSKKVLKNHTRTVHSSRECIQCKLSFLRRSDLLEHNKSIHTINLIDNILVNCTFKTQSKPYQCNICCKSFQRENSLLTHQLRHKIDITIKDNIKNNECFECKLSFLKKSDLIEHNKSIHSNLCNNFISKSNINLVHKCNLCSKNFKTEQDVLKHVNAIHNKLSPFACSRCSEVFKSEMQLRMHKTTHAGMYMFD